MRIIPLLALTLSTGVCAQTPDATSIIQKVDDNMSASSRIFTSKMIIHNRRNTRTVESKTWSMGESKAYSEYLSPAREKGTKMLKLGDQLWIYSPETDRIIQISGHMLRQSVMGSDMSYEDMMEDPKLLNHYKAEIAGEETIGGRSCWIIHLTAFTPDVTYEQRKLWVDKERMVPVKEEMYAKSGILLKKTELSDFAKIQGRWYPKNILFKDMLKEGSGTEFVMEDIRFDVAIPDYLFSKASLKQ